MVISEIIPENDRAHAAALSRTGFWGKRAAGCIFFAGGEFMLLKRSAGILEPNTWGCCGGAIDDGEEPAEAVRREAREEAGYAGPMELVPFFLFKREGFSYANFVAAVPEKFAPKLNWESSGHAWVGIGEWPEPLHPGLAEALADPGAQGILEKIARRGRTK